MAEDPAWAWPPDIAPEFNFSSPDIQQAQGDPGNPYNEVAAVYQEKMKEAIARQCPACVIEPLDDRYENKKYRVRYPDGWWFEITLDPAMVEIVAKPESLAQFYRMRDRIKSDIFDVAARLGLTPAGAGHLNFGVQSTFGSDSLLFRNFIVDLLNHPGVMKQVLNFDDIVNAPHIEDLPNEQIDAFKKVLADFDAQRPSVKDFATALHDNVYLRTAWDADAVGSSPYKYQALNVVTIVTGEDGWPRLEIRCLRGQRNVVDFLLLGELFQARLRYLRRVGKTLAYVVTENSHFDSRTQPLLALQEFYQYVTEAGLNWQRFRVLVPEYLASHLETFEKTFALPCGRMAAAARPTP